MGGAQPVEGPHDPGHHGTSQISWWTSIASSQPGDQLPAPRVPHCSIQKFQHHEAQPVTGIFDWIRGATVRITGLDHGSRVFLGSGFFVAPGWVLSAAHVVAEAVELRLVWRGLELTPLAPPV